MIDRSVRNSVIALAVLLLVVIGSFIAEASLRSQVCASSMMVEAVNGTTSTSTAPEACS